MKLTREQLQKQLPNTLAPVYLVSGDEVLLVQETLDHIRQAAKAAGFEERHVFHVEKGFDWSDFLAMASSLSLFGDKKCLELRIPNGKPGDDGSKAIQHYVAKCPGHTLLIIVSGKLDKASERTKWHKAIMEKGAFIPIWPLMPTQVAQWIKQRMAQFGLKSTHEGIQTIIEKTEGNLLATAQTIEKIHLEYGEGSIEPAEISAIVTDSTRFNLFELMDCALQGNSRKILKMLTYLKNAGTDPTLILWAILRECRTLANITFGKERGQPLAKLYQENGIWDRRKPLIQQAIQQHPFKHWQHLIQEAERVDEINKGIKPGSPWGSLTHLCLMISGAFPIRQWDYDDVVGL